MYTFHKLPEVCPWVPDFTDSRTGVKPTERRFFASEIPLPAAAAELLPQSDQAQGLYLRSTQKALSFTLPAGVSCVVRVRGRPVLSVWEPKEPTPWAMEGPEAVPVELFLILPPELDPATLPLFLPKAEAAE